ncbi:MAG: tetratricopeptide repeat protein [Desulfobacteraceae bacterium]|nr:tetratricopeptide repeat protein [Desulfobacteraceae bacterium]
MQSLTRWISIAVVMVVLVLAISGNGYGQLKAGQPAPLFTLKDPKGKTFELAGMKEQPMLILYFFDVDSKSSQEGLLSLDGLAKKYKNADLVVWGITRAPADKVNGFLAQSKLNFSILVDSGAVSDLYAARLVLPTVCIVGPDLTLLDYIQGGGKTTENLLIALAERKLQNRQPEIAKVLSQEVVKKDPANVRAKSVQGYAALKEGDLKTAEKTFYTLSTNQGEGEIVGKEGLSQVYARQGQPEKAMSMAKEVEQKAGERAYTHVVRGDLLYSQNKPQEAEAEYRKAIDKAGGNPSHRAMAYNQLGRIYTGRGEYQKSLSMYDQAVALDPYYVEATSNKGMTFERQGEWDKALESYHKAQTINHSDPFATTLAANAQKMLLLEKDAEKRREVDAQVTRYVQNYKDGVRTAKENLQDTWSSQATMLILLEPVETGGLASRDGFARVLILNLADQLNTSGRVSVMEPYILEMVIEKLGLTQKELANTDSLKRLAVACGATIVGKGTLFHLSEGTLLKYQLADMRAQQAAPQEIQRQFASAVTLQKDLHWLNREILTTIIAHHPLQAFVVEVTGAQVLMNIGANQGVVTGALFDVVEEKPPVEYKGKQFQPEPVVMATLEVVRVEKEFAYAQIKEQRRPIVAEDKLRESARQVQDDEQKTW